MPIEAGYIGSKGTRLAQRLNPNQARDVYNLSLSKSRSGFDIRHCVVASGSYELPFGKGTRYMNSNTVLDLILGGWQTNAIAQWRSGFAFSVLSGLDTCNCAAAGQMAQQIGDPRSGFTRSIDQWFNTSAFARPATGTFGSSGRNILDGPGQISFDISLFKSFRFSERIVLQFRAEAFSAFNNTGFNQPGGTVGTPTYGVIQGAADPRVIQLALKLRF